LAATEIATANLAGNTSRHMKRAQRLLDDSHGHAPRHLAELASQVATTELRAGRAKPAKRLMKLALVEPTDNALAQAECASANGLALDGFSLDIPLTYEARALRHSHVGDWQSASQAGLDWLADQPFAHEAAQFTSYVASVGAQDWQLAEHAARTGLVANPDSHMLRNNLAFALANQGRASDAREQLDHVLASQLPPRERAIVDATTGLVLFRLGDVQGGREAYRQAVDSLEALNHRDQAALAHVFWAREEVLAGSEKAPAFAAAAADRARRAQAPEARLWSERLQELLTERLAGTLLPRQLS
jgi:tetratricopeptide (TPR) repeat protein